MGIERRRQSLRGRVAYPLRFYRLCLSLARGGRLLILSSRSNPFAVFELT